MSGIVQWLENSHAPGPDRESIRKRGRDRIRQCFDDEKRDDGEKSEQTGQLLSYALTNGTPQQLNALKLLSSDLVIGCNVAVQKLTSSMDRIINAVESFEGDVQQAGIDLIHLLQPHITAETAPLQDATPTQPKEQTITSDIMPEMEEDADIWRFPVVVLAASDAQHLRELESRLNGPVEGALQTLSHLRAATFHDFPAEILLQPPGAGIRRAILNLLTPSESTDDRIVEKEALRTLHQWLVHIQGAVRAVRHPDCQSATPMPITPQSTPYYPSSMAISGARGLSLATLAVDVFQRCAPLLRDSQLIYHTLHCLDVTHVFLGTRGLCQAIAECLDVLANAIIDQKGDRNKQHRGALWQMTLDVIELYCGTPDELACSGIVSPNQNIHEVLADIVTDGESVVLLGGVSLRERALPYATACVPEIVRDTHYVPRAARSCSECLQMAQLNHKYVQSNDIMSISTKRSAGALQQHNTESCTHDLHVGDKLREWVGEVSAVIEGLLYVDDNTVECATAVCVQGLLCSLSHDADDPEEHEDNIADAMNALLPLFQHPRERTRCATLETVALTAVSPNTEDLYLDPEFLTHVTVFGLPSEHAAAILRKASLIPRAKPALMRVANVLQGHIGEDNNTAPVCSEVLCKLLEESHDDQYDDMQSEEVGATRVAIMVRSLYHHVGWVRVWASRWVRQWLGLGDVVDIEGDAGSDTALAELLASTKKTQKKQVLYWYDPMGLGLERTSGSKGVGSRDVDELITTFMNDKMESNVRAYALLQIAYSDGDVKWSHDDEFIDAVIECIVGDVDNKLRDAAVTVLSRYILPNNPTALQVPTAVAPGPLVQVLLILTMAYEIGSVRRDASIALALLFFHKVGCVDGLDVKDKPSGFTVPAHVACHYTFPMHVDAVECRSHFSDHCPPKRDRLRRMIAASWLRDGKKEDGDEIEYGVDMLRTTVSALSSPKALIDSLDALTTALWRGSLMPEHCAVLEEWLPPLLQMFASPWSPDGKQDEETLIAVIRTITIVLKRYGTMAVAGEKGIEQLCQWVGSLEVLLRRGLYHDRIDGTNDWPRMLTSGLKLISTLLRLFPAQSIPIFQRHGIVTLLVESTRENTRVAIDCIGHLIAALSWWNTGNVDARCREARSLVAPLFSVLSNTLNKTPTHSFIYSDVIQTICQCLAALGVGDYDCLAVDWIQANLIEWLKPISSSRSSLSVAAAVSMCGAALSDESDDVVLNACVSWLLDRTQSYAVRTAACTGIAAACTGEHSFLDNHGLTSQLSSLFSEPRATPAFLGSLCKLLSVVARDDAQALHTLLVDGKLWLHVVDAADCMTLRDKWTHGVGRWGPGPASTMTSSDESAWQSGAEEDIAMQCASDAANIVRECVENFAGARAFLLTQTRVVEAIASTLSFGVSVSSVAAHIAVCRAGAALVSNEESREAFWHVPDFGDSLAYACIGSGAASDTSLRQVRRAVFHLLSLLLPPQDDSTLPQSSLDEHNAGSVLCRVAATELDERAGTRFYGRVLSRLLMFSASARVCALEIGLVERVTKRMRQAGSAALDDTMECDLRDVSIAGHILACMLSEGKVDGFEAHVAEIPTVAVSIWPVLIDAEDVMCQVLSACVNAVSLCQAAAVSATKPPGGYGPRHTLVHLCASLATATHGDGAVKALALRLLATACQHGAGRSAVLRTGVVSKVTSLLCAPSPSIKPSLSEREQIAAWKRDMLLFLASVTYNSDDVKASDVLRNADLMDVVLCTIHDDDELREAAAILLRSIAFASRSAPHGPTLDALVSAMDDVDDDHIIAEHASAALLTLVRSSKHAVSLVHNRGLFDSIVRLRDDLEQVQQDSFPQAPPLPHNPPRDGAMPLSTPIRVQPGSLLSAGPDSPRDAEALRHAVGALNKVVECCNS